MIHRTLLEWERLSYGHDLNDEKTIPEGAAARLAAVAKGSRFAGRGEEGVLEFGRKALRARGGTAGDAAKLCGARGGFARAARPT